MSAWRVISPAAFFFPLQYFLLLCPPSVLISLCSSPPISHPSLLFHSRFRSSSILPATLSALSSEPSHFLPFQPFSFLPSTSSPISLAYCDFSWCVSSPSSKYCAIKWFENRLTPTVDLMRSPNTGVFCGHRSV